MKASIPVSLALLLTMVACGGTGEQDSSSLVDHDHAGASAAHGGGVAAGGGGGGAGQVPPAPSADAAAWFINNASAVVGTAPTPDVDFGALQNTVPGAIRIGDSRVAQVLVYNTSKKTPLTISDIAIAGANPGDFAISAASVSAALQVPVAANKGAAVALQLTFAPTAEGPRAATLRLISNAGTALVSLVGSALAARPIIAATSAVDFLPTSAPATAVITNNGGATLVLGSLVLAGSDIGSFEITVANQGFSNCFAGMALGPHGSCFVGIGVVAGAPAPSNALLVIQSNDPAQPETDIQLRLAP
ncbi:MAG: choice-of-anchor D domain-containing protein [Myxococcales bacterium]